MDKKIAFLCDGKNMCCEHGGCFVNGGECYHTTDIEHAKDFEKDDGGNYWQKDETPEEFSETLLQAFGNS